MSEPQKFSGLRQFCRAASCVLALFLLVGISFSANAEEEQPEKSEGSAQEPSGEAAFFHLEEDVITSASKYAQKLIDSPSAISVINQQDIHQSGTLDITQLFRFSPGTLVVEPDSLQREVIIRGYPQSFSPRLLVLMDGIPLYTPLFSGVSWSFFPFSLPSIERVEIIRGASSTLYGANAFSGVINIVSKKVDKERGFQFYNSTGNLQLQQNEFIYNQPISDKVRMRLSLLFRHDNGYGSNNGDGQFDGQVGGHGMLDLEADLTKNTRFKFYAYGKGANRKEPFTGIIGPQTTDFTNFLGGIKVQHDFTEKQSVSFQTTFQNLKQTGYEPPAVGEQERREVDVDLQYTGHFGKRHTLVGGASFRYGGYEFIQFLPPGLQFITLASVFANYDLKILENLILTTGGRYEYDSLTQSQLAGRANLTYLPWENQAFRFSVARAVRTPSLIENRTNLTGLVGVTPPPLPPTAVLDALGNPNLEPESVLAFEFGYHGDFFKNRLNADVQFYYNNVYDLITFGLSSFNPAAVPPLAVFTFENRGNGHVYGFEIDVAWQVFDWWRTGFNYTLTRQGGFQTGQFPDNLLSFKNRFAFKNGFSAELLFNWTSPYTFFDPTTAIASPIGDIFRLDARIAQKIGKHWEVAIVGQNLIDSPHSEASSATVVNRLIYGTISFNY